jgi:hypothetical protein
MFGGTTPKQQIEARTAVRLGWALGHGPVGLLERLQDRCGLEPEQVEALSDDELVETFDALRSPVSTGYYAKVQVEPERWVEVEPSRPGGIRKRTRRPAVHKDQFVSAPTELRPLQRPLLPRDRAAQVAAGRALLDAQEAQRRTNRISAARFALERARTNLEALESA